MFDAGRSHFYLRENTQFNSVKVSFSFQKVMFSSVLSVGHQLTQQQSSYQEQLVEDSCTTAADDSSQARCLLI